MMFFFRKKPIQLDFYIDQPTIHSALSPKAARHFMPEWWKTLDKAYFPEGSLLSNATMKTCRGFIDQYQHGVIIPLWTDFAFRISKAGEQQGVFWQSIWTDVRAEEHPREQWGAMDPERRLTHLKLVNPWAIRCSEDIPWAFSFPTWNSPETLGAFCVPPGTMRFNAQSSAHLNTMFIHGPEEKTVSLKAGTPVIHLVPLTERPVEVRSHLVTTAERNAIFSTMTPITAVNNYKFVTQRAQAPKRKCPFGFGK